MMGTDERKQDREGTSRMVADCLYGYAQGQVTPREAMETLGLHDMADLDAALEDAGLAQGPALKA